MKVLKPSLIVVSGYSGAGKDTIGDWLVEHKGYKVVKCAEPGKRALEFMLKCPVGTMDDRVARLKVAPFCQGRTYLQVLVDFWKHRNLLVGSELFTAQTREKLVSLQKLGQDVVITDVRNMDEAEMIRSLGADFKLEYIQVINHKGCKLESDVNLEAIDGMLKPFCKHRYVLKNDSTKPQLYRTLETLY